MKKMDEMELAINQKGIKWSWLFLVVSLFIWGIYDYLKTNRTSLPIILLSMQFLLYFFVISVAKMKVGDDSGKKQILFFIGFVVLSICFGAILYLTSAN